MNIYNFFKRKHEDMDYEVSQRMRIFIVVMLFCPFATIPMGVINYIRGDLIEAVFYFIYDFIILICFILLYQKHFRLSAQLFIWDCIGLNFVINYQLELISFYQIYTYAFPALFIIVMSLLIFYRSINILITGLSTLALFYVLLAFKASYGGIDIGNIDDIFLITLLMIFTTICSIMIFNLLENTIQIIRQNEIDRRNLQEQLLHLQKMDAVGRLAGGVAHDFNNLLTVIFGCSELLSYDKCADDESNRELISNIKEAADKASNLTKQLLAFSRKQFFELKIININTVIKEFKTILNRLIGENIRIITNLDPSIFHIRADTTQIEQVLLNLVVNAKDAMPDGGTITVETSNVLIDENFSKSHINLKAGEYTMLSISDTGSGMEMETTKRIFEPFFTTKENGKGSGLGLATVYGIVKQHGGDIYVYSEKGKGTLFKIYFPPAKESPAVQEVKEPEEAKIIHKITALIAEDDEMLLKLISRYLENEGFTVLPANNALDALKIARENSSINLLITDVIMPGMNGKELNNRICEFNKTIKTLFMSGYTETILEFGDFESGNVHFIHKPFTANELIIKIKTLFEH
jgi:signal transduction histidine kinase